MASLDFLRLFPSGNATLMVILPDGTVSHINNLDPYTISNKCPLLSLSFEHGMDGVPKASIEATSLELVIYFLRYLYLSDYLVCNDFEPVPCSLLIHAELCKMAENYDLPELQIAAHVNLLRETELSCSRPTPPLGLCEAIRFIYEHLADQQPLIETLLNYCVFCFQYHALGSNPEFRKVAYEIGPFHRDLCRTSFNRGFQDDGAAEIVCLPVCRPNPHSEADLGERALGDFLFELWCDSDGAQLDSCNNAELGSKKRRKMHAEAGFTLVYRPKDPNALDTLGTGESSSDEGFTVVHRPNGCIAPANDRFTDYSSSSAESDSDAHSIVGTPQYEKLEGSFITIKPSSIKQPKEEDTNRALHEIPLLSTSESTKVEEQFSNDQSSKTTPSNVAKPSRSHFDGITEEDLAPFDGHASITRPPLQEQNTTLTAISDLQGDDDAWESEWSII
ncbi:hypothetical protein K469DRAFT_622365 [Zopfia rhizophila CBS 207.26]|uniref:BTB domain-containing protein n=1 Tax=Zopfia rhizophila CBS 207.26 TaxID=1314779 RepID=A0A6A6EI08_9PEZI|nr:hypothetical protein K469DRAFT_622365 [Zopfia rhizophila CBS 207.26]